MNVSDVLFYFQVDILLAVLSIGIIAICVGVWFLQIIAIIYGLWKLNRKVDVNIRETPLPGVSIIKPLVDIDNNLASNLESFFTLKYPQFELLFCVHDDQDRALILVNALISKYPTVQCRVFIGEDSVGLNPKINNMLPAYLASQYDFILISDAGIKMREDSLYDMVLSLSDKMGLVTQLPFAQDRSGFPGTYEKVFFGTGHARFYLGANALGIICSTGMSCLIRKCALEEVGGMKAFGIYIAEDYFFAHAINSKGWGVGISSLPAIQNHGRSEIGMFQQRLTRWAKLRIAMLPLTMFLEPLSECLLCGALTSLAVQLLLQWNSLIFFLVHTLVWMLSDYVLLTIVQGGSLPFGRFEYVISWTFMQLSALPIFLRAVYSPLIQWRKGLSVRLKWGGVAEQVQESNSFKQVKMVPSLPDQHFLPTINTSNVDFSHLHLKTSKSADKK